MQHYLNFTYTLKKPIDGGYGSINDKGEWTGMVAAVKSGEFDVGNLDRSNFALITITIVCMYFSCSSISCDSGKRHSNYIFPTIRNCIS